ncbi:MAG: hypothetical protein WCB71_16665 [Aestuariivirga sp.]
MKKIYVTILALAALSTASFANSNRSWDLRDSDTYFGKYAGQMKSQAASEATTMTVVSPLAIEEKALGLNNFERMKKISEENDHGGH